MLERCEVCGGADVRYAAFSGGREYWCGTCESNHPYPEERLPPRLKLLRDGDVEELKRQMREELPPVSGVSALSEFYRWVQDDRMGESG